MIPTAPVVAPRTRLFQTDETPNVHPLNQGEHDLGEGLARALPTLVGVEVEGQPVVAREPWQNGVPLAPASQRDPHGGAAYGFQANLHGLRQEQAVGQVDPGVETAPNEVHAAEGGDGGQGVGRKVVEVGVRDQLELRRGMSVSAT
eukprot:6116320-Pyramimonas_sp.AAC.1